MKDVLDFISRFKGSEDVFLYGCCYWFAFILQSRFHEHGYLVDIFHEPIDGHFVARFLPEYLSNEEMVGVKSKFFDIRGDVTHLYDESEMENVWVLEHTEPRRWGRLMCDCREFIEPDKYPAWLKS